MMERRVSRIEARVFFMPYGPHGRNKFFHWRQML